MAKHTHETHGNASVALLRAAVLGANDGLISTSSLVVGVAAAHAERGAIVLTAFAGLVAGALSMAAGEYVSVASQADTEAADRGKERSELASNPDEERAELAGIYVRRGLTPELAQQVADQLTAHDALGAHLRDELGYTATSRAQPLQAAGASAASFALGAVAPLVLAASLPPERMQDALPAATVGLLALLGATAARLGGASWLRGALRVSLWGIGAMLGTALIGRLFDVRV